MQDQIMTVKGHKQMSINHLVPTGKSAKCSQLGCLPRHNDLSMNWNVSESLLSNAHTNILWDSKWAGKCASI